MNRDHPRSNERGLSGRLVWWVDRVQRSPKTTLAICLATSAIALVYATSTLHFSTRRTDLLRPDHPVVMDYQRLRSEFDRESDMIVVAAGPDSAAIASVLEQVAERLRSRPDLFEKVLDRIDVSAIKRKGLFQLSIEQLRSLEKQLGPLVLSTSPPFSWLAYFFGWNPTSVEAALQSADLNQRVALLRSLERHLLSSSDEYTSPFAGFETAASSDAAAFADPQTKGFVFSPDKRLGIVRVLPMRDAKSFVGLKAPVAELRRIVAEVGSSKPDVEIGLTGLPILEDDEMQAATSSGVWAASLEIVGVMLVFFVGFRAMRHPMLIQLALVVAGGWTLGMVAVTVGRLNILSTTFILTLIGMGVDFGVVWLTRFESARAAGTDVSESNRVTAAEIGPGVVSGAVTTTVAFYATMVTDFVGLREMGWIAGTGVLVCLFSMITVLPAALALCSRSKSIPVGRSVRDLKPAFAWAAVRPRTVVVVSGLAAAVLAARIPTISCDYNLLHLQARGLSSVEWEHRLMREMKASGWFMQLSVATVDDARRVRDQLEKLPEVGRIVDVATLLPVDQEAKRPIVERLHTSLKHLDLPGNSNVDADLVMKRLRTPASNSEETRWLGRVLVAAETLEPRTLAEKLEHYESLRRADLRRRLDEMKAASHPEPTTIDDLPPTLLARYRGKSGRWLVQVFPKQDAWDFEPLESFVKTVHSVDPHATGEPTTSLLGVVELVNGFKRSSWLAALVVFAACWIDLRSLNLAILAMIPLVVGCTAAFGAMALIGMSLNPANLIALPLILGLGVDFGVHILHDYSRSPSGYVLNWRLARALVLTTATTIVGFSSLLVSNHSGMIGIGVLLSLGVACCSAAALLTLPAALNLLPIRKRAEVRILKFSTHRGAGEPMRRAA